MHKVFISYHHENDQGYKESLATFARKHQIFIDASVYTEDILDGHSDESIRELIRDHYLRDSTVTIVLVGTETKRRKHVDWEVYSSMYDGTVNKRSGILVINLPTTGSELVHAPHGQPEKNLYLDITSWTSIETRAEYERVYPYMPDRPIDNLLEPSDTVSVLPWDKLNETILARLIDLAFRDRGASNYDLSRPMKQANS